MSHRNPGVSGAQYWFLIALGIAALVLIGINIAMSMANGKLRAEVAERQQYINQSVQLARFNGQLIQGLATLAARTGDDALRGVLNKHGVDFTVRPAPEAAVGAEDSATGSTASAGGTVEEAE